MASLKGQYGRIGSASMAKGGETRFFSVIKGIPDLPLLINDFPVALNHESIGAGLDFLL